ncbi:uncharacterized protein V1513DRAFT_438029 [Lipomyces chichibuensis]|uniref:uncharacterized protein n=1 Tax=Lipomyces chichibuensis TaxID=1546026 RepID=UPI0033439BAC
MSSRSPPQSSPSSPSSKKAMPIPIPIPTGSKSALAQGAIISPTQIHRRASLPCWPPPNSSSVVPSVGAPTDQRRATTTTTNNAVMQISPSLYGCSPDQRSPAGFQRFQYPFAPNFNLASSAGSAKRARSLGLPPSPPSSAGSTSPTQSPTSSVAPDYVVCDHHHHRRQSIAVRFRPQDNDSAVDTTRLAPDQENRRRGRRLSGGFARPPSPTGERILKGEVSF